MAHLQLFLSAVSKEFAPYRADMATLLDRHDLTVKVQEDFIAGGSPTLEKLDDYIRNCDAVIHLAGDMTGAVTHSECVAAIRARYPDLAARLPAIADGLDPAAPVFTYTQWEAYLALYHGRNLFIAAPVENAERDARYLRDDAQAAGQAAHLGRLAALNRHPEITFRNADDLTAQLYKSSILDLLKKAGLPLLRRINTRKMPTTFARRLYGREDEMARLHAAWHSGAEDAPRAGKTNMLVIDAMGGAGKTALIKFFTDDLAADGWRGAEAVYVWSFYSQGTDEKRQGSADEFFSDALTWFGYDGDITDLKSQHAKGQALAELVRSKRTLLILDGLEPLQYGPPRQPDGKDATGLTGGLKDQGIAALLDALALDNPGLALVTTRLAIPDLADTAAPMLQTMALYHISRLPPERLARERAALVAAGKDTTPEDLRDALVAREREIAARIRSRKDDAPDEALATAPAVELLAALGVKGTPRQLFELADDLGGHALALNLFGKFLVKFHRGDVRRRDLLPSADEMQTALGANTRERERNPFKVMHTYEIQFEQQIAEQLGYGAMWTRWSRLKNLVGMGGLQLSARALATSAGKQLSLLQLLGLFDRPVGRAVIDHLLDGAGIPDLTDGLGAAARGDWTTALVGLRDLGLVLPEDSGDPDQVDAHPLVREYFGARLAREKPEAWRAAHGRVYEYYKTRDLPPAFREPINYGMLAQATAFPQNEHNIPGVVAREHWPDGWLDTLMPSLSRAEWPKLREAAKLIGTQAFAEAKKRFQPEGEAGMTPLFAAIAHGCAAGRYEEAFAEVYWPRIARGNEDYAAKKLGLFGSELGAIAQFFEQPFSEPAGKSDARPGGLSESDQAMVLNGAGFSLRALGRLAEALEPFKADTQMSVDQQDWQNAAIGAGNLSELQLVLGDGAAARASAEDSVAYADKSGDDGMRTVSRTTLADALFNAGGAAAAAARFAEAETLQAKDEPGLPRLYSLQGYRYCDLLLARGRAGEVLRRAEYALRTVQQGSQNLLDMALAELSLGRAHAALARGAGADAGAHREKARARLDAAVDGLRNAGTGNHVPRGLLARAAFHRQTGNPVAARADLRAVLDAAERSEMRLFLIDARIEEALQWLTPPGAPAARPSSKACASARAALDAAETLIGETGLKRREADLALARARLALTERAPEAVRAALAEAIRLIGDKGWWGLLPDLAELIDTGGFDDLRPDLARLQAAAAAYHRKADAAWYVHEAYAQALRKRAENAQLDEMLANSKVRSKLGEILTANNIDTPLDDMPPEAQRDILRKVIAAQSKDQ